MKTSLYYQGIDSTQAEYARLSEISGSADRWVVRAGSQTCGRGRDENSWYSPPGGLWQTFDLIHPEPVPSFTLYVGSVLHRLLIDLFGLQGLSIKWPNDIYLGQAKLAGILCQHQGQNNKYIIGIGINTNIALDDVKHKINIANLFNSIGYDISNSNLALLLAGTVDRNSHLLYDPRSYLDYCDRWLYGKGSQAELIWPDRIWTGLLVGLASDGSVLLRGEDGREAAYNHGSLRILPEKGYQLFP